MNDTRLSGDLAAAASCPLAHLLAPEEVRLGDPPPGPSREDSGELALPGRDRGQGGAAENGTVALGSGKVHGRLTC